MNFKLKFTTKQEKFAQKIYNLLVENFSHTYFVGGVVRDAFLRLRLKDFDIATAALPSETKKTLADNKILFDNTWEKFGNIVAKSNNITVEITTFRKDLKGHNRYHTISYLKSAKGDSKRRDFTVNALYLSPKDGKILDFHNGLADLKNKTIRFIGNPKKRITEDPLRIIRALRFALVLNFKLEKKTKLAIKNNFDLINNLTKPKIEKEVLKIKNQNKRNILKLVLDKPNLVDKYFK